jgi:NADPH-dependent curcumin reductase CurA
MPNSTNQQILLKSRPVGEPKDSDFALVETPIPEPRKGEVLNRTIYLSLDPYMRGRMSDRASYASGVELGSVMVGGTVSQVVKSNHLQFSAGDFVLAS